MSNLCINKEFDDVIFYRLLDVDENFRKFVEENKDRTIREIAEKYNINLVTHNAS